MALSLITFVSGTTIKSAEVNSNFTALNSALFAITNTNIDAAAGIVSTKLATINTPNKVDGISLMAQTVDSVKGQFSWFLFGDCVVGTSLSAIYEVSATLSYISVALNVQTAPTGADIIVDIRKKRGAGAYQSLFTTKPKIVIGATTGGGAASFDTGTHGTSNQFIDADLLTFDISQKGSTIAGANITVALKVKQKVPQ